MCYPNHTGVDLIPEAGGGANVTSPVKGTVVTATYSSSWGNYVRIKITGSSGGSTWNRVAETGRFYPQMTVNVRNAPTTTSPQVAQYYKGESFVYDSYVVNEGYIWLSYISGSGVRRYVAWRVQGGEKFGYIV
ncbi:SH3 domain-containing protein [Enterococcus sp. CWB-B31]|nr:SH3 domain-containing protein [Enterococcus sp. CWB-B31]